MKYLKYLFLAALLLISTDAFATTRYISPSGAGALNGTSAANAWAFANAAGFATALTASSAGDTIHFECGRYAQTTTMTVNKTGSIGSRITIEGCNSENSGDFGDADTMTIFVGNRQLPTLYDSVASGNADTGPSTFTLSNAIDYITFQNMRVERAQYVFNATAYNNDFINITDVFIQNIRTGLWIYGDAACQSTTNVYTCADGSNNWVVTNFDGEYISKHHTRIERGVHDIDFTDCNVDGKFTGNGDFGMGFMNGTSSAATPVYNIDYLRCTSTGFAYTPDTTYDNGDGFVSEIYSSNLTFTDCYCLDTWDGCFDLKGGPHTITNSGSFRDGTRPFKFWNGPITISNSIVAYNLKDADSSDSNYEQLVQRSDGSQGGIWAAAVVSADKITFVNDEYFARFDSTGNKSLTYVSGNGTAPTPGALVTGGSSGTIAKIAGVTGNGTSGTLYIFNGGTFTNPETITDTGGFSATTSSIGTAAVGGKLTITNSVLALTSAYTSYGTVAADEDTTNTFNCNGLINTADCFESGSGNVIWEEGVVGTDPQFTDTSDHGWVGCNQDYNSALYTTTKGYNRSETEDTCVDNSGQEPVVCDSIKRHFGRISN